MTRLLRIAAVTVLAPPVVAGAALSSTRTGIGLAFGAPTLLVGAVPILFVLTAGETRIVLAAVIMMIAAGFELWLGVSLLDDSFPGDTTVARLSIALGILTLLTAFAMIVQNARCAHGSDLTSPTGTL